MGLVFMEDRVPGGNPAATDPDGRLGRVDDHVAPRVIAPPYAPGNLVLGTAREAEIGRRATVPVVGSVPGREHDRALTVPLQEVGAAQVATLGELGLADVVAGPELEPLRLRVG